MTPPESLETARLFLRKPRYDDAPLMFAAYAQDSMVTRYMTWRPHTSPSEAHAVIEGFLARWQAQTEFCWLIFTRATAELIGSIWAQGRPRL
jgi:ribosomal-protein-alanine N-acetyltransferase